MMLNQFDTLSKARYSCRQFEKKALPDTIVERLIDIARSSPSSYNLQPTHYVVVRSEEVKKEMFSACLKQPQILEAPCIVVFACDRLVVTPTAESILQEEVRAGGFSHDQERPFRAFVKLGFDSSRFGFSGWVKRHVAPLIRLRAVLPVLPVENMDAWLAKQGALSAMTFMLAATAAGLSTCPMEAFDEKRLKKILHLGREWYIPLIVAVGYGKTPKVRSTRLPLSEIVKWL